MSTFVTYRRCRLLLLVVVLAGTTACLPHGPAELPGTRAAVGMQVPATVPYVPASPVPVVVPPETPAGGLAPAQPPSSADPSTSLVDRSPAARGAAALAGLGYDPARLGWTIAFRPARTGYLGLAYPDRRHIDVFVRRSQSDASLRATVAHEIGHAVDLVYGDGDRRAQWRRLRGFGPEPPWFGCDACADYATGAGDFAEVFSFWLVGPGHFQSRLAAAPTDRELAELVPLFAPPKAAVPSSSRPPASSGGAPASEGAPPPERPGSPPASSGPPSPRPSPSPSPCLLVLSCS